MNYNAVISVNDITDESGIDEPVTLQEMKDYLRLEGYIDTDESTADSLSDFDFDDDLIEEIIKASREAIEQKARISIIPKTLEAIITNMCGMQEIPFGPVREIVSLFQEDGTTEIVTPNYTVVGNKWKYLKYPCQKNMTLTYEAGYGTAEFPLPNYLKIDIMRLCAYMYENRGEDSKINEFANYISAKYSRNTGII